MRMPQSETRVVPTSSANGYTPDGRWLAQYHDDEMDVWFDIGDPHPTFMDAAFATIPWPDGGAKADYRAVHEFVRDAIGEKYPDDDTFEHVVHALGEFIETARWFRKQFETLRTGSRLINELLRIEEEIAGLADVDDLRKHRRGTEIHGKLRRALKVDVAALPDSPEKREATAIIKRATSTLLREVFGFDAEAAAKSE